MCLFHSPLGGSGDNNNQAGERNNSASCLQKRQHYDKMYNIISDGYSNEEFQYDSGRSSSPLYFKQHRAMYKFYNTRNLSDCILTVKHFERISIINNGIWSHILGWHLFYIMQFFNIYVEVKFFRISENFYNLLHLVTR